MKLYILLNATQSIRVPSQRWRISRLLEDGTRSTLYREQLLSFQSNKSYSFEYCVPIDTVCLHLESPFTFILHFTYRPLGRRSTVMTVFIESVYLFSLSLHSKTRIVRIPCYFSILCLSLVNESILFSQRDIIEFRGRHPYETQLIVIQAQTSGCISLNSQNLCLLGGQSASLSPDVFSGVVMVSNPSRVSLSMISLLDLVERSANAHISPLLRSVDRLCDISLSFNGRREWINAIRLPEDHINHRNAFYILGSNQRHNATDIWHFVDFQYQRDEGILRLGMASKQSFDTLRVVSDALDLCETSETIVPFAYNPVKVDFGSFVFYKHVCFHVFVYFRNRFTCNCRVPSSIRFR